MSDAGGLEIVVGAAAACAPTAHVVRIAAAQASDLAPARETQIRVAIAAPALAEVVTDAVADALRATVAQVTSPSVDAGRVIRVRSRKAVARRGAELAGAIAIVPVTARNARFLVVLIDQLRTARAVGIQLVWDGRAPARPDVEAHVFAALERARATPTGCPVVLADSEAPAAALRFLIAHRLPR